MNTKFTRNLKLLLAVLDFVLINFTFFTFVFYFWQELLYESDLQYLSMVITLNLAWLLSAMSCNVYNEKYILSSGFLRCSRQSWAFCMLFFVSIMFYFFHATLGNAHTAAVILLILGALLINRVVFGYINDFYKKSYFDSHRVLMIGYNNLSIKLAEHLEVDGINKKIIGYCEEEENVHELSKHPILGNISDAMSICTKYNATEIYSTITPDKNANIQNLINSAEQNCIRFRLVPNLGLYLNNHTQVHFVDEIPVISQHREPLESINNRIIKRTFDLVFSVLVLVFINSWLIPLIGLLIKLESRGPVFFLQERSGENNVPFYVLKFRSMRVNKDSNSVQATKGDKRVTKIGKFLRRTSLDEFPQFLNVLKGDMSIVGPRPHMLKHTDEYSKLIEKYMVRQFLKPGITGWAQVSGYRGETQNVHQMEKRVEHDVWYMENWSVSLDIKIIFKTVYNAIKGEENAY